MISPIRTLAAAALLNAVAVTSAMAGVISEDFTGGTFDSANFEIADGTGSTASEAWVSQNRGTLRTVADNLIGTATSVLNVQADLTFFGVDDIAFLGVRSSGLKTAPYDEPGESVFLRVHNFQNGHTGIAGGPNFVPYAIENFGDSFYTAGQRIHINLTDNGSLVTAIFTNTVTEAVETVSLVTSLGYGGHVVFSATNGASWDNIEITHASAGAAVPAPAGAVLLIMGLVGVLVRRKAA